MVFFSLLVIVGGLLIFAFRGSLFAKSADQRGKSHAKGAGYECPVCSETHCDCVKTGEQDSEF